MTMQNIKFKGNGNTTLQASKSGLFQSIDRANESSNVQRCRSFSFVTNQFNIRSPRGTEFGKEVRDRTHGTNSPNDDGQLNDIISEKHKEDSSTESEEDTSSDGDDDSSIDAALDGEENEDAIYKKLIEA